ncbi:DUF4906 domain-containing protein [Parabacteroides sp.]
MILMSLVLMNTGCEEQIDPANIPSEGGKMVEVSLNVGFADEADGYTLATKSDVSSGKGAFSYELQPSVSTKGDATMKPEKLYYLEIQQYDRLGKRIGGITEVKDEREVGSTIELSLQENPDCQLVIVAWGYGNTDTKNRLGNSSLADVQKLSLDATTISNLDPEKQSDMNKMPYVLHLEHVNATASTIKSSEGKDVRLLLKRLAARLTLNWTYLYTGYKLKQILLESIPLNYNVVTKPENGTYPSLLDQFTTIQIDPALETGNTCSCWIPANVRGTNSAATSQNYRIKSNAPTGSSYVSFIAVNNDDPKKKLNYRVYLGGSTTFDFNIVSNTNYNYKVSFNHTGLPTNDRRVTIIDPIPASENNNNLVPTANCFMVAPGGGFCFNPYKFYIKGQLTNNNVMLGSDWCNWDGTTIKTPIKSVKVLWQTKENGDVGDPVLGVVTSDTEHTNIVDLVHHDDLENARIYCRVAPNTTGGSGVIAAYDQADGKGNILWSWHIWVTDYKPTSTGNSSVDEDKKQKQKYTYGNYEDQLPMMDRNLGAQAGYTTVPPSALEKAKTNGFLYQWGRKDPFPASYTSDESITQISANLDKPTVGILNLYSPDGFSYCPLVIDTKNQATFRDAYKTPVTIIKGNENWNSNLNNIKNAWGGSSDKTVHDPCPAGWRITEVKNYRSLFTATNISFNYNNVSYYSGTINKVAGGTSNDGGVVIKFDNSNRSTYIRYTGYWYRESQFNYIGTMVYMWCRDDVTAASSKGSAKSFQTVPGNQATLYNSGVLREAMPVRCIQEQE